MSLQGPNTVLFRVNQTRYARQAIHRSLDTCLALPSYQSSGLTAGVFINYLNLTRCAVGLIKNLKRETVLLVL